jgi:hypothetical protein
VSAFVTYTGCLRNSGHHSSLSLYVYVYICSARDSLIYVFFFCTMYDIRSKINLLWIILHHVLYTVIWRIHVQSLMMIVLGSKHIRVLNVLMWYNCRDKNCIQLAYFKVLSETVRRTGKEERNILHTVKRRKTKWIGHILHRNCRLKHIVEVKIDVTRRRGRGRKRLLGD